MYGHVITKFSRMGSLPHSFTHGAPLRASRARAPLLNAVTFPFYFTHTSLTRSISLQQIHSSVLVVMGPDGDRLVRTSALNKQKKTCAPFSIVFISQS